MLNRASALGANYETIAPSQKDQALEDAYMAGNQLSAWGKLPRDRDQPGFAPGMDDLGQIILNNKHRVKFNKNTMTFPGAKAWVAKKNSKISDVNKHWQVAYEDINDDNIKDVIIRDAHKNIKYINGWHLGKPNNIPLAHQKFIEHWYGLPEDRNILKAQGGIPKGALSRNYFLFSNTKYDPKHPDAPLQPNDYLRIYGYKPRAPSASNLLLSYVTKYAYKNALARLKQSENNIKMIKKICSVVQANAIIYNVYVIIPVEDWFQANTKLTVQEAKKKKSGDRVSFYTEKCLERVAEICKDDKIKDSIEDYITDKILPTVLRTYQYKGSNPVYFKDSRDPNQFSGSVRRNIPVDHTVPDIASLIGKSDRGNKIDDTALNVFNEFYDTPTHRLPYGSANNEAVNQWEQQQNAPQNQFVNTQQFYNPIQDEALDHTLPEGIKEFPSFVQFLQMYRNVTPEFTALRKKAKIVSKGGALNAGDIQLTKNGDIYNYLIDFYRLDPSFKVGNKQ